MVLRKVKVIKRDESADRRITRTKDKKQKLLDEYSNLLRRAAEIKRELQTI